MSNIGPIAPLPASSAIPSYSPLGKPVVGNENAQEKDRALPPVEQGAAGEQSRNRVESKPEAEQRERRPGQQGAGALPELPDETDAEAVAATAATGSAGVPTIRILPAGHAEQPHGRAALDAFNQPVIDPGLLLDQRV